MISDLYDTSNRPLWGLKSEIDFLNHGSFGASPKAVLERQNALREIMEMDPVEFIENLGVELWEEALIQLSDFVNADRWNGICAECHYGGEYCSGVFET